MSEQTLENPSIRDVIERLGLDPTLARFVPVEATVDSFEAEVEAEVLNRLVSEGVREAAEPVENGRPRMLKLTAWMAHSGPANRNGDAFLDEDLREIASDGLFTPPYVGIMDFNHDFTPYGVWYSAEFKYNEVAQQNGLLVEGALFAWRFPELADKVLAEQSRKGYVDVSMAALPSWIETREADDGSVESVLRKPVFVAVSILDVPPGDPNARGYGSESPDSTKMERQQKLNQALLSIHAAGGETFKLWTEVAMAKLEDKASQTISQEDTPMDEKIINELKAALEEALGEKAIALVDELKSAVADAARVPSLEAKVAELEEQVENLSSELAEAIQAKDAAETEVESVQAALEAKDGELTELRETYETLEAAHNELLEGIEAKRMEALRESRLEALPEKYREALEKRPEETQERIVARFVEMSDEEFAEELELLGNTRQSFADRTTAEGELAPAGGAPAGGDAVDKFL